MHSTPASRSPPKPLLDGGRDVGPRLLDHVVGHRAEIVLRPADALEGGCVDEAHLQPLLVDVHRHRAHEAHHRLGRREHAAGLRPALCLLVGALLDVVGAQPDMVPVGKVQVGQGVGLTVHDLVGHVLELAPHHLVQVVDRAVASERQVLHRFLSYRVSMAAVAFLSNPAFRKM